MFSLKLFSAPLLSMFFILPSQASESEKLTRILEYVQTLDERITKLENELKSAGRSSVVSGSKIALGGWVDRSAWSGIEYNTHSRQVLSQLGEPSIKEQGTYSDYQRWIYEGTVNGKYLMGYLELEDGSLVKKIMLPRF